MARDVKEILVGMLVVAALFLAIGLSYGGGELAAPGGFELHASFNRVDGLAEGDEVRLAGIRVGSVERQTLDDKYRAVVTFRLDSDLRLPTDTSVAIHTDGLFGAKFAILEPGGEEEYLGYGDEIVFTQDAVVVEELLELIIAEGKAQRKRRGSGEGG